jgi:proteasome beta subunit
MKLYSLEKGMEPTVDVAASFLANIVYSGSKNFFPYMIMFILAGKGEDGWKMYSLDPSGSSIENTYVATGSGMELALGIMEDGYDKNMTIEQGKKLAIRAVTSAIRRDVFSGEGIDIAVIDKNGFRKVDHKKLKDVVRDD